MQCMNEQWRVVPGCEGYYEVSDMGRIRSLDRYVPHARMGKQFVRGRILKPTLDRKGYFRISLRVEGMKKSWGMHRAFMAAFHPIPDWEEKQINHKDGVTTNNSFENLEWCTSSENRIHAYRVLHVQHPYLGRFGERHPLSKPVIGVCIKTGERRQYGSAYDAGKDGFKPSDVNACAAKRQHSHKGWMWFRPELVPESPVYSPGNIVGTNNGGAHAVICIHPDGSTRRYEFAHQAASDGFTDVGISAVLTGRQKRHRGCEWRLA